MFVVQNESPNTNQITRNAIQSKFVSDFNGLYENKRNSDVILMAGNQEFSAHKAILTARSVVFAAMFDNQMRESIENKVEIQDIDPEVLEVMLLYIYTGNIKDMDKIGTQLMTAADKYGLDQLKIICSQHLITNMSLNTAIESLILSKLMDDYNLKKSALEFIRDNIRVIINTKDWNNLKKTNSELLDEIVLFSTNHSIETKIRWNLTKLSQFKTKQQSLIKEIQGIPWGIMAIPKKPQIEDQQRDTKHLGVFLFCGHLEPPINFSCNVRGELKLISIKEGIPDITREFIHMYDHKDMDWGFLQFERLDTLLDPKNGYIRDDTIILEANITVDPPKGL